VHLLKAIKSLIEWVGAQRMRKLQLIRSACNATERTHDARSCYKLALSGAVLSIT
jgi:hypothetical protein